MKPEEFDSFSKDEFNAIKDKCKSRARFYFYLGLALMAFIILILFMVVGYLYYRGIPDLQRRQIVSFILLGVMFCAVFWLMLNNYRFLRKSDGLDTPGQLLYWFEKKIRNDRKSFFLSSFVPFCLILDIIFLDINFNSNLFQLLLFFLLSIGVLAYEIYQYRKPESIFDSPRDKEIIGQLRELTEKK